MQDPSTRQRMMATNVHDREMCLKGQIDGEKTIGGSRIVMFSIDHTFTTVHLDREEWDFDPITESD